MRKQVTHHFVIHTNKYSKKNMICARILRIKISVAQIFIISNETL